MPVISGATAPTFDLPNATFTGLASPSRGAKETCVWRTKVHPGAEPGMHSFDHEEVLVVVAGAGVAHLGESEHPVVTGDAIVVPSGTQFGLGNPHGEPLELIVALPVGALAHVNGQTVVPMPAQ
ncbi:cupin domain-containing protein [Nonomuraea sediminis]|uniref:cupin domain-containing protein n=1 Tax=Nonomuraea sediminis TaxID=2835864 RepID=UPI001BDD7EDC|nr:cupin domain-containing protein [Nonomuraea sediminis]